MDENYIYHYTSIEALCGILEHKCLWLTNITLMNDKKEMSQFISDLKKAIKEKVQYGSKHKVDDLFKKYCGKRNDNIVYTMSFSKNEDDAAQWDRYADNGHGVCISFSYQCLQEYVRNNKQTFNPISLNEVFYPQNESDHDLARIISDYINDNYNNAILRQNCFEKIEDVFSNAWACSFDYKHCSFASENEVRLSTFPDFNYDKSSGLHYALHNNNINEHYEFPIENISDVLFKEITIGPKSFINTNVLQRYICSLGYKHIKIKESTCPLR
jgi:hypothetical protein